MPFCVGIRNKPFQAQAVPGAVGARRRCYEITTPSRPLRPGPGAEERRATAIVIIGGQLLCLLLTLLVTPVAYSLLNDLRGRSAAGLAGEAAAAAIK